MYFAVVLMWANFAHYEGKDSNECFTILTGAVFYRYRRFEDVILAAEILRMRYPVRLVIFGSDVFDRRYGAELRSLVEKKKLDDTVIFAGRLTEPELIHTFQRSDAFVWANHNQSWGNAVFEALACGVPTVVSKTARASEVLEDEETSLLVDPLQPELLAQKIERLIVDDKLRQRLVAQGLSFVRTMPRDHYSESMTKLFEELVSRKRSVQQS